MARGWLDDKTLEVIARELPNLENIMRTILSLDINTISMRFPPNNLIPVAAVCLNDCKNVVSEAMYAFHESLANKIWYGEKRDPPCEISAIYYSRFYADDVAIRLYSASEHLAKAIVFMLEIEDSSLKKYRTKNTSLQTAVGKYLMAEKPDHPISAAVKKLIDGGEWDKTIGYRNKLVHEQPPALKGLGITFKRKQRWQTHPTVPNSPYLLIGTSDNHDLTIDDLIGFIKPSLFQFTILLSEVVEFYLDLLSKEKITVNTTQPGIQISF